MIASTGLSLVAFAGSPQLILEYVDQPPLKQQDSERSHQQEHLLRFRMPQEFWTVWSQGPVERSDKRDIQDKQNTHEQASAELEPGSISTSLLPTHHKLTWPGNQTNAQLSRVNYQWSMAYSSPRHKSPPGVPLLKDQNHGFSNMPWFCLLGDAPHSRYHVLSGSTIWISPVVRSTKMGEMTKMTDFRTERDSMGDVQVPADAYYGAQTQRAVDNFLISLFYQAFTPCLPCG